MPSQHGQSHTLRYYYVRLGQYRYRFSFNLRERRPKLMVCKSEYYMGFGHVYEYCSSNYYKRRLLAHP